MSKEGNITPLVLVDATKKGWRLYRNSRGVAWVGQKVDVKGGGIMLRNPRRITFGLHEGASDLIGVAPTVITQDMVGQTIGVFASVEVKTLQYKGLSKDQRDWLRKVKKLGGIALVAMETATGFVYLDFEGVPDA